MATTVLLRLAALTGEGRYRAAAEAALASVGPYLGRYPTAFAQWLVALDVAHARVLEVAVVGDPGRRGDATAARAGPRGLPPEPGPRRRRPDADRRARSSPSASRLDGRPTAFVCREFACRQPVNEPEALAVLLAAP